MGLLFLPLGLLPDPFIVPAFFGLLSLFVLITAGSAIRMTRAR